MEIIKQGKVPTIKFKMECSNCGCEAIYTPEEIKHDKDGDYVICPCCKKYISHDLSIADKDINKEIMDKMAELREKQNEDALSDIDYKVYFDPAFGFDTGSAVVYHNDKVVDELTIKDLELLHTFLYAVKNNKQGAFTFTRLSDEQYEEVLRRFREVKNANV